MRLASISILLLSCSEKETEDTNASEASESCAITLVEAAPASDATAVPRTALPSATLSANDSSATLTLTTAAGDVVEGSTSTAGNALTFTPAGPLELATGYTATATWCSGAASAVIPFTTTAGDLVGNTYRIPLDLTVKGTDTLVYSMLIGRPVDLLLQVTHRSEDQIDLTAAISYESNGPQNVCLPTTDIIGADFTSDPQWVSTLHDLPMGPSDSGPILRSVQTVATISPGNAGLQSVRVSGDYDVRDHISQWSDLLGSSDPFWICGALAGFGFGCDPCVSDGEALCIQMWTKGDTGTLESDTDVSCVSEELCHPDCIPSTCDDPSAGACD